MRSTLRHQIESCVSKGMLAATHLVSKYRAPVLKDVLCTKETQERESHSASKKKQKKKKPTPSKASFILESLLKPPTHIHHRSQIKSTHLSSISQHSQQRTPSKHSHSKTMKKILTLVSSTKNDHSLRNKSSLKPNYNKSQKHLTPLMMSPDKQPLNPRLKTQIIQSLVNPSQFQRILSTNVIVIHCRMLPNRLIQLQITPKTKIIQLEITLLKQGCQCQSIHQLIQNPIKNKPITLLTSVRTVKPTALFPKIKVDVQSEHKQDTFQAPIPLTWLHCIHHPLHHKKLSRIRTKTFVQGLPLQKHTLHTLQKINKRLLTYSDTQRGKISYEWGFVLDEHRYQMRCSVRENKLNIEVEGRGEETLTNMLQFMQHILM